MCIEDICGICYDELLTDVRVLECKHIFHTECINLWIERSNSCPFCRSQIFNTEYERLISDPSVRLIDIYRQAQTLNLTSDQISDIEIMLGIEIPDTPLNNIMDELWLNEYSSISN